MMNRALFFSACLLTACLGDVNGTGGPTGTVGPGDPGASSKDAGTGPGSTDTLSPDGSAATPDGSTSPDAAIMISTSGTSCGMQLADSPTVFCDTFDAPSGIGNRSGDLDGNVWGVSRAQGGGTNFGQSQYGMWNPTLLEKCDGTTPRVMAPNDIIICNGQLREASNDNNNGGFDAGDVTSLAMYAKQPFDFANRTGTVSFDVSNDAGPHGAWPEFWLSDLPVPDPFNHFDSWQSLPANGLAVRFDSVAPIGMGGECPDNSDIDKLRFTVDSAAAVRGYVLDDTQGYGANSLKITRTGCVIEASGPDQLNHIELRISKDEVDVYATDAGVKASPTTLKQIAKIENVNLTLTRGLIWLEDVHYNGDKILDPTRKSQREHTFAWDNVAFDGPFTYRDFSYDAPDAMTPATNGAFSLGKHAMPNQATSWSVPGLPSAPQATAARVLFEFNTGGGTLPKTLDVTVNGHAHPTAWPYPETKQYDWRTFAVTIPLTDVVAGTNTVELGSDAEIAFANVNLVLVDVTGGVPALPGSVQTFPQ